MKTILSLLLCLALCAGLSAFAEASPAPGVDLSFLSGYVDAVGVGGWYLACEAATQPEAPHDSATRNFSAPWALLNERGEVLAEGLHWWPEDDPWPLQPRPFEGFADGVDTAVLRVGQKYGLIDRTGRIVVEPVYDAIFGFEPGDTSTPAEKDGRWGSIDEAGNVVVPFLYDSSFPRFEGGLTVAQRGGRDALLAEDGTELLPPEFTDMECPGPGDAYGMAHRGDSCVVFDRQGNILFERKMTGNSWIYTYQGAVPPFEYYDGAADRYGYVNLDGTDAVPPVYDNASSFYGEDGLAVVERDGKQGAIRRDGSVAIPLEYDWLNGFCEGLCAAEKGGLWGYLDEGGEAAIPFQYASAGSFFNGYAAASPAGGRDGKADGDRPEVLGLIDKTGAWVVAPTACDAIDAGADGVAVAGRDGANVGLYRLAEGGAEAIVGLDSREWFPEGMLPHEDASALARLDGRKTLKKRVSEADRLPCLDGAARLYPLYAAFVEAVYPKDVKYESWGDESDCALTVSGDDTPWQRLSDGAADIIFMPAPDPDAPIWATFAARGQTPVFIPLCRDAVVFLADANNPVESLTAGQLAEVYAGTVSDWSALGAEGLGRIVAYQGAANTGSADAFRRVCGFEPMADAPEGVTGYDSWEGMVDIGPVPFRDLPNAVGYALRSGCGDLLDSGKVRCLAVDGVAPTDEAIADGSYPFAETLYAVALEDNKNPNVTALLDWIQSAQGAELAVKSGFVGVWD